MESQEQSLKPGDILRNGTQTRVIMERFRNHENLFVVSHSLEEVEPTMLMSRTVIKLAGYEVSEEL